MKVMVVSDPKTDKSAAAMDVNIGIVLKISKLVFIHLLRNI